MKKIGIIGSGTVAKSLGEGFIKYGYEVMASSREPEKLAEWKSQAGEKAKAGTFEEAAKFGDLLALAVKGSAAIDALKLAGEANLSGKTIIDATNPIAEAPPDNGVLRFFTDINESLMERLQKEYPQANFVKAFNIIGSAFMVNPDFAEKPTMFICGNNDSSKNMAGEIITQFGFELADMGGAEAARAIEPLCILWCIPGFRSNEWSHAFRLLKK